MSPPVGAGARDGLFDHADLADRVVVMQHGRVVEGGDVRSLLRAPKEKYTQVLLGSMLEGKKPMTMLTGNARD